MKKKSMIEDMRELRTGMRLICPDSGARWKSFEITFATDFSIDEDGFWHVGCGVCGATHRLNTVDIEVQK